MNKSKSDWGCLHLFILGFAIFAVILVLIIMLVPSKGDDSDCRSLSLFNMADSVPASSRSLVNHRPASPLQGGYRTSVSQPLKDIVAAPPMGSSHGIAVSVSFPHGSDVSHVGSKPRPVTPPKGGAPAKPSKPSTKPHKGSTTIPKGTKVDIDVDDCD